MKSIALAVVINAIALWLTTVLLPGNIYIIPEDQQTIAHILTLVFVAFVFGLVNATIGRVLKFLAFPLFILTLGFLALVVNALLLLFTAWLTQVLGFGFGLVVNGFWAGFWAAVVLSIISWLLGLILRPAAR